MPQEENMRRETLTEKEYRNHPAISRSELWRMHESPEKFLFFKEHPAEATPAMLFGQVVHKLLLQPESFREEFAVAPVVDRRTKAGKEEYEMFASTVCDRAVISKDDYDKAMDMAVAVRLNPLTERLLKGIKEEPFFWTDKSTGEECKVRVDCLTEINGEKVIVDYKTTSNAQTETFSNKDMLKYGYYMQAAMYSEGVMRVLDLSDRPKFVFIVQEKSEPYAVNVIAVSKKVMLAGVDKFRELLGKYHQCKVLDFYPGYNEMGEINETIMPKWMALGVEDDDD